MKEIKVELLAPAGDFQCFQAAINAGADAVYLGGEKFGARAYANNFTVQNLTVDYAGAQIKNHTKHSVIRYKILRVK